MKTDATWRSLPSILVLLLGAGISILWSVSLERTVPGGIMGFPGIYYGTQCLIHHCDPYSVQQLESFYEARGAAVRDDSVQRRQAVTLYVNLPTTFLFVTPFTLLPLHAAQALWATVLVGTFLVAACLMWQLGAARASGVSAFLAFVILANCEVVFAGGNTAGLVVALCVIAVWCFVQARLELIGVLCLAAGLAIKPHDAGLIWIYFLLAGGALRKRALQAAAIAGTLAAVAAVWVSVAAPHWLPEMRTNLAAISAPGGINNPGPASIGANSADMIVDLQTVFSIVRDQPAFYNSATYLACGIVFLVWARAVRRACFSPRTAWFALVAASALSMLVTYHRSYDARLLLLAIPACAELWTEGGATAWIAFALTSATIAFTGDIPLTIVALATDHMQMTAPGFVPKLTAIVIGRPAPLLLLATALFYLWALVHRPQRQETPALAEPV